MAINITRPRFFVDITMPVSLLSLPLNYYLAVTCSQLTTLPIALFLNPDCHETQRECGSDASSRYTSAATRVFGFRAPDSRAAPTRWTIAAALSGLGPRSLFWTGCIWWINLEHGISTSPVRTKFSVSARFSRQESYHPLVELGMVASCFL